MMDDKALEKKASRLSDDLGLLGPHKDNPWQVRVIFNALREVADKDTASAREIMSEHTAMLREFALKADVARLQGDIAALKNVLRGDESQMKQWQNRNLEMRNDLDRTVLARDEARAEVERLKLSMLAHFNEEHLAGDGPEIDRWKREVERLREALGEAAMSMETIANAAGSRDGLLLETSQVRGYARSRAAVARAALRGEPEEPMQDSPNFRPKELDDLAARDYERQNRWKP